MWWNKASSKLKANVEIYRLLDTCDIGILNDCALFFLPCRLKYYDMYCSFNEGLFVRVCFQELASGDYGSEFEYDSEADRKRQVNICVMFKNARSQTMYRILPKGLQVTVINFQSSIEMGTKFAARASCTHYLTLA